MRIDHLLILAHDLPAMRAFFIDAIGLEDGPRPPFPFPGHWLYSDGAPLLHLAARGTDAVRTAYLGAGGAGGGAIDHLALTGADPSDLLARLGAAGITPRLRRVPAEHQLQIFVDGPEGVKVEMLFAGDALNTIPTESLQ